MDSSKGSKDGNTQSTKTKETGKKSQKGSTREEKSSQQEASIVRFQKFIYKQFKTMRPFLSLGVKVAKPVVAILLFFLTFMFLTIKAPYFHNDFIMAKVGSRTYKITDLTSFQRGGTGFQLKTKDYGNVIITNYHICKVAQERGHYDYVAVHDTRNDYISILHIIKSSPDSDLCMVKGMPGVEGLSLGSKPDINQDIQVLGHASLYPLTITKGKILKETFIWMITDKAVKDCDGYGLKKIKLWNLFPVCLQLYTSYVSNASVHPGNSGSPVINFWGNVVAVVFAKDTRTNYGFFVTWDELTEFVTR